MKKIRFVLTKGSFIVFLCMALSSLAACSLLPKEEETLAPPLVEPTEIEYETEEATIKTIVKEVDGVGNLVPSDQENLFFTESGGRLEAIHVNAGDQVEQGQVLAEIDTGNLSFSISQAEIDLEKAKLHLAQLQEQEADSYAIEIAKLDIQSVELRLNQMKEEQRNAKIISPVNGFVTFVTDKEAGDTIEAYEDLIQVADPQNLQIIYTATSPQDLKEVNVGMPVSIDLSGQDLQGEVVQTPSDVPMEVIEKNDIYQRSILVRVDEIPENVEAGDVANIVVVLQEKENALTIPRGALRTSFGREYVQVLTDESKREVDVEKGIVTSTEIEVLKGLEEGDQVILK
ncbi:efflux RND transporter periplasmic adaptor subunit [Aquibacillus albus]|uniref:RND family efflux transporter MFP subunit n=1 Tax=Aquibacillus albus TaxID=1168171 RepID=A0ABS2N5H1_9BACI|nr:HlyD family efflux transporter periplasmic adaptor subunit [Aquibacillus albus]MBM7573399.1 RND family efflux transporter MFP subunit [Aquibacillus albus]